MLLEQTAQSGNEVVGEAYDIAAYYLKRTGFIQDSARINDHLLEIICEMFRAGDRNKIRLANRAITKFGRRRSMRAAS